MQRQLDIREHMEVIGADGGHVGTVDKVEGERIKLTRGDRGAGGRHHWVPLALVADIEGSRVRLSTTLDRVPGFWDTEGGPAQPPPGGGDATRAMNRQAGSTAPDVAPGDMGRGGPRTR